MVVGAGGEVGAHVQKHVIKGHVKGIGVALTRLLRTAAIPVWDLVRPICLATLTHVLVILYD